MDRPWLKHYPEWVSPTIDASRYPSIAAMLEEACRQYPSAEAMRCIDVPMTYSEFDRQATAFACYLQNTLGINKGDRIAIMLPNLLEFPIAFFGCQKVGAICVNTNPLYTPREMQHQFQDSGCKVIVILDLFVANLEKIISQTGIRHVVTVGIGDNLPLWKRTLVNTIIQVTGKKPAHSLPVTPFREAVAIGRDGQIRRPEIDAEDVAVLQYTGGTTGVSKGAMLCHRNIIANIQQNLEWAKEHIDESGETVLCALPLYHIYALSVNFLSFLTVGQRMILVPRPIPISKMMAPMKKYEVTLLTVVNTLLNELVHHKDFGKLKLGKLKMALAGGMALQRSVAEKWESLTGIPAVEGYGLTEASPVTHCNPLDDNYRLGTIGLPLPGTEARVVNEEGAEVEPGKEGELIVRGPQVMLGYWNRPDETANAIRDGWLWTGDMATMGEDGFFSIVDRKKDMILVSGFNVFPNEVEQVLTAHPKVLEAAVIGVPDRKSGERVKAFLVTRDSSLTEDEIRAYCKENLAGYKCPKAVEFRPELPKSVVGKVLRRELRDAEPSVVEAS